jgi:hypothetical protein
MLTQLPALPLLFNDSRKLSLSCRRQNQMVEASLGVARGHHAGEVAAGTREQYRLPDGFLRGPALFECRIG